MSLSLQNVQTFKKLFHPFFISRAHKLTLALIIITLLMITILGLILLKIQKPLLTDLTFNF